MDTLERVGLPWTSEPEYPERHSQRDAAGHVALIGAGPGDPELITVRGLRLLRAADVVVYDRLIAPALLDEARPDAERIYVGKGPGCHSTAQEAINETLIARARLGRFVARLKGGDPFVFGRGGEEAQALVAAGVSFEVVPGVTSAIAAPAYAGIPVTHRGLASMVTIITGHSRAGAPDGEDDETNWKALSALATLGGTIVALMGVGTLPRLTARLLAAGLAPETPAAVVERGSLSGQRVARGSLADIAQHAAAAGLRAPATTVIGSVAALADTLAWSQLPAETGAALSVHL